MEGGEDMEKKAEIKNKVELKVPKKEFNPRIQEVNVNDERFFAYESQKSHH